MKHVQVYLRELIGMLLAATKTLNVLLQMDEGTTEKELTSMFNMIEKFCLSLFMKPKKWQATNNN